VVVGVVVVVVLVVVDMVVGVMFFTDGVPLGGVAAVDDEFVNDPICWKPPRDGA
jgi:hypothetical protein